MKFTFDCFNERRAMLWMSKSDVGRNIIAFGRVPALVRAWDAYEAFERK